MGYTVYASPGTGISTSCSRALIGSFDSALIEKYVAGPGSRCFFRSCVAYATTFFTAQLAIESVLSVRLATCVVVLFASVGRNRATPAGTSLSLVRQLRARVLSPSVARPARRRACNEVCTCIRTRARPVGPTAGRGATRTHDYCVGTGT